MTFLTRILGQACALGAIGIALALPAHSEPFAYISNRVDDTVSVIDTATNTVVATVTVGDGPGGVAVHPDGSRVYVANFGQASGVTVSVIDTATNTVVATVVVGDGPGGVAVHPDGSRVYVANDLSSTISVIDTATDTVVDTVAVGIRPQGVAVHPDGSRVYVANAFGSTTSVIDTATNSVVDTVAVGGIPIGVAVHPDGSHVYVGNGNDDTVSVIDTATNTVVATVVVGDVPRGVAVHPDGSRVYVANFSGNTVSVIDTATNTVVATMAALANPDGVAVHPDGSRVYVANFASNTVSVIDTATNSVVDTVAVGIGPSARGQFIGPVPLIVPPPSGSPANFTGSWTITVFGDNNISDGVVIQPSALEVEISASSDSARDLDVTLTEGPNSVSTSLDIFTETMAQLPFRRIPFPGFIVVDLVILSNGNVMALAFVAQENFDPLDISFRIGAWQKTPKPITRDDFIGNWRTSENYGDPNLRATTEGFSLRPSVEPFTIRAGALSNTILLKSGLFSIELRVDGNRAFLPTPN